VTFSDNTAQNSGTTPTDNDAIWGVVRGAHNPTKHATPTPTPTT